MVVSVAYVRGSDEVILEGENFVVTLARGENGIIKGAIVVYPTAPYLQEIAAETLKKLVSNLVQEVRFEEDQNIGKGFIYFTAQLPQVELEEIVGEKLAESFSEIVKRHFLN